MNPIRHGRNFQGTDRRKPKRGQGVKAALKRTGFGIPALFCIDVFPLPGYHMNEYILKSARMCVMLNSARPRRLREAPMDLFDIIGPVMIGPSSSHTAGAARIGKITRMLLNSSPVLSLIHI